MATIMMPRKSHLAALFAGAVLYQSLLAQSPNYSSGQVLTFGGTLPGTCNVGELYAKSTATIGLYVCTASNTWTAAGGGLPLTGTGATVTTSTPLLDLSQTWNASGVAFTGFKQNITNTASASGSKQFDLQIGGNSQNYFGVDGSFGVNFSGNATGRRAYLFSGDGNTRFQLQRWSDNFGSATSTLWRVDNSITTDTIVLGGALNLGTNLLYWAADTSISRSAAGQLDIGTTTTCGTAANCRDLRLRHLIGGGTAPTVSNTSANSCGTTAATIAGTDTAGRVTVGATSGTSCTVTFGTAFTNAPSCWANNETTGNLMRTTSSTTTVIVAGTMVGGDLVTYGCTGY